MEYGINEMETQNTQNTYNRDHVANLIVLLDGVAHPIKYGLNKIGRDPITCTIYLKPLCVARSHALIEVDKHGNATIRNLEHNSSTKVGRSQKNLIKFEQCQLHNGDIIQFGNISCMYCLIEDNGDLPLTQVETYDSPIPNSRSQSNVIVPESPDKDDSKHDVFSHFISPSGLLMNKATDQTNKSNNNTDIYNAETQAPENINDMQAFEGTKMITEDNAASISTSARKEVAGTLDVSPIESSQSLLDHIDTNGFIDSEIVSHRLASGEPGPSLATIRSSPILGGSATQVDIGGHESDRNSQDMFETPDKNYTNNTRKVVYSRNIFATNVEINLTQRENNDVPPNNVKSIQVISTTIESLNSSQVEDIHMLPTQNILDYKTSLGESALLSSNQTGQVLSSEVPATRADQIVSIPSNKHSYNFDKFSDKNILNKSNTNLTNMCPNDQSISDAQAQDVEKVSRLGSEVCTVKDTNESLCKKPAFIIEPDCSDKPKNDTIMDNIQDMLTQVLEPSVNENVNNEVNFEDMPTQVLEIVPENVIEENQYSEDMVKKFKKPYSPLQFNKQKKHAEEPECLENDNFYNCTQDIYNDLCSQRDNKEVPQQSSSKKSADSLLNSDEELVVMYHPIPNSQDLIKYRSLQQNRKIVSPSSYTSNTEIESEQDSPVVYQIKKTKKDPKLNLLNLFNNDSIPLRTSERRKKPTEKIRNNQNVKISPTIFDLADKEKINKSLVLENIRLNAERNRHVKIQEIQSSDTGIQVDKSNHTNSTRGKYNKKDLSNKPSGSKLSTQEVTSETHRHTDKVEKSVAKSTNNSKTANSSSKESKRSTRSNRKLDDDEEWTEDLCRKSTKSKKTSKSNSSYNTKASTSKQLHSSSSHLDHSKEPRVSRVLRSNHKTESEGEEKYLFDTKSTNNSGSRITKENLEIEKSRSKSSHDMTFPLREDINSSRQGLKRAINVRNSDPIPKRSKRTSDSTSSSDMKSFTGSIRVLLSKNFKPEVGEMLQNLGAELVTKVEQCTVLVLAQMFIRSPLVLCAVGMGKAIVGPLWLKTCTEARAIVDPWLYIHKDRKYESRFGFSLERTLRGRRGYLKGYNVSATPSVLPQPSELKLIVECSGGTWKEGGPKWICVSCKDDVVLWAGLRRRGAIIVHKEFLLSGVLTQKVDIEGTKL